MFFNPGGRFFFLSFLFVLICGVPVYAASSLLLSDSGNGIGTLTELSGGNLNKTLGIITIDSTSTGSPNGFRLEIESLNDGALVRQPTPQTYANPAIAGNVADYTFDLVATGEGTLGCTEPALPNDHALSTVITLDFGSPTADTVAKKYAFVFTVPAKTSLLAGTFGDELTVTLSDL
jgi:hypothetical protein